jgi:4-amino-4-deoxy-L-arabinose transferase-like glycosyltransferase
VFALLIAVACTVGGLLGGPALGDHEALVAECARQMHVSGDWLIPQFLDTPFIRKPPLGYWLIAAFSVLLPSDAATELPVTAAVARLPSGLAGLGTVLLLWTLGSRMFNRAVGLVAAIVAATSVFTLLYAVNATVEMLLTFCCTWAYAHFWFAVESRSPLGRMFHMLLFYIALGAGMLAKGPAPLALVAVPLAVWWYVERPQRVLARGGTGMFKNAGMSLLRNIGRRTAQVFTRLWFLPGILVFLGVFVPWMIAVARLNPHAWDMWDWQYLQRFQGDYEDTRYRGPWYYIPIMLGLLLPWTPALPEALSAPWMQRFARWRRPLFYVGVWGVAGVAVMSAMEFKKPYYVAPAVPAFLLLTAVVVERLLREGFASRTAGRAAFACLLVGLAGCTVGCYAWLTENAPHDVLRLTTLGAVCAFVLAICGVLFLYGRRHLALAGTAAVICIGFQATWYGAAAGFDNISRVSVLDAKLDEAGIREDAALYWADQRPDARLNFYFRRRSAYMVDPSEVVARTVERRRGDAALEQMAIERASELLAGRDPVYIILDREHLPLLDRLPRESSVRVRLLATVDLDRRPDGDDWIVITNDETKGALLDRRPS